MTIRILIAEDERDVAEIVVLGVRLTWPDSEIFVARNGTEALALYEKEEPDLVILDVVMPAPDGLEVCAEIRKVSLVPILMLTGRGSTLDKVRALDLGADDYLLKPFDHLELLARLRALVRRSSATAQLAVKQAGSSHGGPSLDSLDGVEHAGMPETDFVLGDLRLETRTRHAFLRNVRVPLTSTEYRLLEELARNVGSVVTHQMLMERVWGYDYAGDEHYVKVFIRRLRQKLGDDASAPRYIQNEWGIGYRLMLPPAE